VLHVGRESLTARGYAKTSPGVPLNCKPIDGDKKHSLHHDSSGSNNDLHIEMAAPVKLQWNLRLFLS
jgi:hypothetical protein